MPCLRNVAERIRHSWPGGIARDSEFSLPGIPRAACPGPPPTPIRIILAASVDMDGVSQ